MRASAWVGQFGSGVFLVAMMAGCASVQVSIPGMGRDDNSAFAEATVHSERVALQEAALRLADQPWGEEPTTGFVSVLFGTVADNEQDRVVEAYVDSVERRATDPVAGVLADADRSLANARRVVEAGRQTVSAIRPVPSDIEILESAISETRECRRLYLAALSELEQRGIKVPGDANNSIRDAFAQTLTDMGITADLVAEAVAMGADRPQYAQPRSVATE